MFDWIWRSLGYELEKDIVKRWALNKMKSEDIEEELRLEKLKTKKIQPELPPRKSKRIEEKSQKQMSQLKTYADATREEKIVNSEWKDVGDY
tara:strand:+ start:4830 stop:5105 length:276 start_codon:yes stop_codon:yes gene_type:complete